MSRILPTALALLALGLLATPASANDSPGASFEKACGKIKVGGKRLRVDVVEGELQRKCKFARTVMRKWVRKWHRAGRPIDGSEGANGHVRVKGARYDCYRSRMQTTTGAGWHHLCMRNGVTLGARYLGSLP